MTDSVNIDTTGNTAGARLPLRHTLVFFGVLLQFCGVTLIIELLSRLGDPANCGYRASSVCEEGTAALSLGAPCFLAGILIFGLLDRIPGWSGPSMIFSGFSLMYGTAGPGVAFAWNALTADSAAWAVLAGLISILPIWVFTVLAKGFLKGLRQAGFRKWAQEIFWILEELPQSKRKRKRMLQARGIGAARGRSGRLIPETPRERFQWALFLVESCVALIGGVLAGWLVIVAVA